MNESTNQLSQAQKTIQTSQQFLQSTLDALSEHIAILDESGQILAVNKTWRHFAVTNHLGIADDGIGVNYLEICEKASHKRVKAARIAAQGIRDVMEKRRDVFYLEYPCHSPDEQRWFNLRVTRFEDDGLVRVVVAHEDITERRGTQEKLHRYTERLEILHAIDQAILSARSPREIARTALTHIQEMVPYDRGSIVVLDANNSEATLLAVHAKDERRILTDEWVPLEVLGNIEALQQGEIQVIPDLLAQPNGEGPPHILEGEGVRSVLRVPLISHNRLIGTLSMGSNRPDAFTEEQIEIVTEVANSLAVVIQQSRLNEQIQGHVAELARRNEDLQREIKERKRLQQEIAEISDEERWRIGQDLHDDLGQQLTGITFLSHVLERKLKEPSLTEAVDLTKQIIEVVERAIDQTRELAKGLAPVSLEKGDLSSALKAFASGIASRFGISCLFECYTSPLISDNTMATHLYRIIQEAVSNAIKHGKAQRVVIRLGTVNNEATLSITDDGIGFSDGIEKNTGLGQRIMNYRAAVIGGSLEIQRATDGGTVVTCIFPLPSNASTQVRNIEAAHILVVEDEPSIATMIQEMLNVLGYTMITVVPSGEESIEKVKEIRPSLVLMDIQLAGQMNGVEAATRIQDRLTVPVVYLTGHGDDDTLREAVSTHPFGYLLKPFSPRQLEVTVKMALLAK